MSRRTEKAYAGWIRRYLLFHRGKHPRDAGAEELTAFLSNLAVEAKVSASTQNQALSALLFLAVAGRRGAGEEAAAAPDRPYS